MIFLLKKEKKKKKKKKKKTRERNGSVCKTAGLGVDINPGQLQPNKER